MTDKPLTFDAFISYRHKPLDMAVAKAIHRQIETYRIPAAIQKKTGKKRMGKVFRDQDELPLLADLGEGIRRALEQSQWLIVVCSPDLPLSKWCLTEIDYFIELGRQDHILTVLVAGEPEDSFPDQLRYINGDEREPLAADVRAATQTQTLRRIKREKLRLLAPMLGVGYDDLRRRQRERVMRTAITAGAVAFTAMAGSTAYVLRQNTLLATQVVLTEEQRQIADGQRIIAENQRQIAEENEQWAILEKNTALVSQSKFLSGISQEQMALGDPLRAAMLALEALPADLEDPDRPFVAEAAAALRIANISERQAGYSLISGIASNFENEFLYFEKQDILYVGRPEYAELFRGTSGQSLLTLPISVGQKFAYDKDSGQLAVYVTLDGVRSVQVYELGTFTSFTFPLAEGRGNVDLVFTPGGDRLVVSHTGSIDGNYISVYDTSSGGMRWYQDSAALYADLELPDERPYDPGIDALSISPDGRFIAFSLSGAYGIGAAYIPIRILNLETGEKTDEYGVPTLSTYKPYWFPDGKRLLLAQSTGNTLEVWTQDATEPLAVYGVEYDNPNGFCADFMFSPDGLYLAVRTFDEKVIIYDTETLAIAAEPQGDWRFAQIGFTSDHTLVFRDAQRLSVILFTVGESTVQFMSVPGGLYWSGMSLGSYTLYQPVFCATESFIVSFSEQGMFHLWRKDNGQGYLAFEDETYLHRSFSHDGSRFLLSNNSYVTLCDTESGEILHVLPFGNMSTAEWSPDGAQLLLSSWEANVALYDVATGKEIASIPAKYTNSPFEMKLSVSNDWSHLLLNTPGHTGGLYRLPSLELISTLEHLSRQSDFIQLLTTAVFLSDGQRVCIPYYQQIHVVNLETLEIEDVYDYCAQDDALFASPDRTKIACYLLSETGGDKIEIAVIDANTGGMLWRQPAHSYVYGKPIVWSPDGSRIVTNHGSIPEAKVWDARTGQHLRTFALERPSFSADGLRLSGEHSTSGSTYAKLLSYEGGEIYDIDTGVLYVRLPEGGIYSPTEDKVLMRTGLWVPESLHDAMRTAKMHLQGRELSDIEREMFYLD